MTTTGEPLHFNTYQPLTPINMNSYSHFRTHMNSVLGDTLASVTDPKVRALYAKAQLQARVIFEQGQEKYDEDRVIAQLRRNLGL